MTFDPLAHTYDHDFTAHPIAMGLRGRVHHRLDHLFAPGQQVLELGCGTGEDAAYLAAQGINVTATDASPAMLAITQRKTAPYPHVTCRWLDINAPPDDLTAQFDGVYANFGVLNCVASGDWRPLAGWLAERVRVGGVAAFAMMSPACAWEVAWYALHGDLRTATRRLRGGATFTHGDQPITIHYPTIRRLTRDFAPYFAIAHIEGLGIALPPSEVYGVIERRPHLLHALTRLDVRLSRWEWLARFADHYWIELRRL